MLECTMGLDSAQPGHWQVTNRGQRAHRAVHANLPAHSCKMHFNVSAMQDSILLCHVHTV